MFSVDCVQLNHSISAPHLKLVYEARLPDRISSDVDSSFDTISAKYLKKDQKFFERLPFLK